MIRLSAFFAYFGRNFLIKSGLTESSFKRARTELKEKGYISYQPQGGNQAPIYQIISLIERNLEEQQIDSNMHGADVVSAELADENVAKQAEHVESQEETTGKTVTRKDAEEKGVFKFYQDNFGAINPLLKDSINNWARDMGETLVMEAMKRALDRNKTSWGYVKSILQTWKKKGIRSVNAVMAEDVDFRYKKQRQYHYIPPKKHEVIPDWFMEQKEQKKRLKNSSMLVNPQEADAVRKEIKRLKEELGYGGSSTGIHAENIGIDHNHKLS
ncbi:DnaD domain-containing protein [Oceanobacillus caeni]|uniref:DnaD domain-containing protein n=1 Tax=Oceanobacillus caeni TaxID=405946 RepID=UPI0036441B2C